MSEPIALARRLPGPWPLLLAQVRYQARLLLRAPRAVVAGVLLPTLLLVVTNIQHTAVPAPRVAGYAVLGLSITAWSTHGISLVAARQAGVLKRWRATPLPAWCYFAGRMIAIVLVATLAGAVTVAIGVTVYHVHLTAPAVLGVLVALVMGGLAWASAATAVTGLIPSVSSAWPILSVTFLPVVLVSGVFGTLGGEPRWLATIAGYLPAQPIIDATSRALGHVAGQSLFSAHDLLVLGGWIAGGLIASRLLFRWEPVRQA